jgi:hypothetical protein
MFATQINDKNNEVVLQDCPEHYGAGLASLNLRHVSLVPFCQETAASVRSLFVVLDPCHHS